MDTANNVHDQMRHLIREHITHLAQQRSYPFRSRHDRIVLDQISAVEQARTMWLITWNRYGDTDKQATLQYYIAGVKATILNNPEMTKGAKDGWLVTQRFAEQILHSQNA